MQLSPLTQTSLSPSFTNKELLDFKNLVRGARGLDLTDKEASDHAKRLVLLAKIVFTSQNSDIIEPIEE